VDPLLEQLQLLRPSIGDLVEIAIVTLLFYRLLLLIRRTRAMQILLGVIILVVTSVLARVLGLVLITRILEAILQYGAIAAVVVFQPELRSALARLGQSRMFNFLNQLEETKVLDEIADAVAHLSRSRIGAIIALEREVALDQYAATGSPVDARVSSAMLSTIFTPYSPLHDGAVLIAGDQIKAAGAILPLTQSPAVDRMLGTRHRAALGLSEETDSVVIVVSEENSTVSVAMGGKLERDFDRDRLRAVLEESMSVRRTPTLTAGD
jgi:diadenylate cyclase